MEAWRLARTPRFLLGASLSSCLFACNAILGIAPPKDEPDLPSGQTAGTWSDDGEELEYDAGTGAQSSGTGSPVRQVSLLDASPYAWAAWPMPNSVSADAGTPQALTVQASGTVLDSVTRLQWQQTVEAKPRSREKAEAYCAQLDLAGGGFRLPSRIELLSLVNFTEDPYLDPEAFPDAPAGKYWSSSRYVGGGSSNGWLVNFEFSTTLVLFETADKEHLVRCVR